MGGGLDGLAAPMSTAYGWCGGVRDRSLILSCPARPLPYRQRVHAASAPYDFHVAGPWTNFGGAGSRRVVTFVGPGISWPLRLALAVALLVPTALVLILIVPAGIVALLVFLVASAILSARDRAYRVVGRDRDGRQNVRVIDSQSR